MGGLGGPGFTFGEPEERDCRRPSFLSSESRPEGHSCLDPSNYSPAVRRMNIKNQKKRRAQPRPAVRRISRSRSSSAAALFRRSSPHFRHRWITTKPFFGSGSVRIASRIPPQSAARSPGFTSTCREERQKGQWFREVYPSGGTSFPQAAQINPLSFLVKRFVSMIFLTFLMEIV